MLMYSKLDSAVFSSFFDHTVVFPCLPSKLSYECFLIDNFLPSEINAVSGIPPEFPSHYFIH